VPPQNQDFKLLLAAEFTPGSPGGDWFHIKQLLRNFDWNRLSWWSMFGEPKDTTNLGSRLSSCGLHGRLTPSKKWLIAKRFLMQSLIVPRAAAHLRKFIEEQQPDLIWIMAHDWTIPVFHQVLPRLGIPWHISLYDMPDIGSKVCRLGPGLAKTHLRMAEELYAKASSRCVIGQPMATEMERTTGVRAELIERCAVEPEALEALKTRQPASSPKDAIRIGYAGTILAEEAFALFVAALQSIRQDLPVPVEIHMFGSQRYGDRPWFDSSLIVEHGFVTDAELDRIYGQCHWGLAMMNMDDNDPRYNRFSFPCKFTMGLSFGIPLICLGHPESGLMEVARRYDLGIMISDPNVEKMAVILKEELPKVDQSATYRAEVARCAETDFNAEVNRQRLHALFQGDLK
jgi:glycosyltransferase involved in cell wall biosynthesis